MPGGWCDGQGHGHLQRALRAVATWNGAQVTSAMNHDAGANCFVSSDPLQPQRCMVRARRRIEIGEERLGDGTWGDVHRYLKLS